MESEDRSLPAPSEGTTLAELEAISSEAGLDPLLLRQAARELEARGDQAVHRGTVQGRIRALIRLMDEMLGIVEDGDSEMDRGRGRRPWIPGAERGHSLAARASPAASMITSSGSDFPMALNTGFTTRLRASSSI